MVSLVRRRCPPSLLHPRVSSSIHPTPRHAPALRFPYIQPQNFQFFKIKLPKMYVRLGSGSLGYRIVALSRRVLGCSNLPFPSPSSCSPSRLVPRPPLVVLPVFFILVRIVVLCMVPCSPFLVCCFLSPVSCCSLFSVRVVRVSSVSLVACRLSGGSVIRFFGTTSTTTCFCIYNDLHRWVGVRSLSFSFSLSCGLRAACCVLRIQNQKCRSVNADADADAADSFSYVTSTRTCFWA
ncbi:hypothetical protein L226DRAFT_312819 [Lentinus tigrinus ALCF2SS1-7]|uniref:uncharacterized protein n=1 Tax=Lentinus tigrinus ALCF2SS1-7 TaxID=1328758 RepID=UPI001165FF69|nr:hypothetical protein L226DRAFT_312819 [Lentinus tigrinus ALCF2SS1-7]